MGYAWISINNIINFNKTTNKWKTNKWKAIVLPPPSNNLVWAILTTLFCCLPFGIVSIIHSCKVDSLYNAGDYAGAVERANQAKKWAKWAVIAGIATYVISAICYFVVIAAAVSLNE